jgi:hypothetical protein
MQEPPIEDDVPNERRDTEQPTSESGNEIARQQSRQWRGPTTSKSLRYEALVRCETVRRVQSGRLQD